MLYIYMKRVLYPFLSSNFAPSKHDMQSVSSSIKALLQLRLLTGYVAASHHVSLSDALNGYCLYFYTTPKEFNN